MKAPKKLLLALYSVSAAGTPFTHAAVAESAAAFEGKPVRIGNGTGRVVVRVDPAGTPTKHRAPDTASSRLTGIRSAQGPSSAAAVK
jgi:hypothetical protein